MTSRCCRTFGCRPRGSDVFRDGRYCRHQLIEIALMASDRFAQRPQPDQRVVEDARAPLAGEFLGKIDRAIGLEGQRRQLAGKIASWLRRRGQGAVHDR